MRRANAYTKGTGTWSGTAGELNAQSFYAGTTIGTFNLSVSASTSGAEAGTARSMSTPP
jgi:hypothetical protein